MRGADPLLHFFCLPRRESRRLALLAAPGSRPGLPAGALLLLVPAHEYIRGLILEEKKAPSDQGFVPVDVESFLPACSMRAGAAPSMAAAPAYNHFARFDEGSVLLGSAHSSAGASRAVSQLSAPRIASPAVLVKSAVHTTKTALPHVGRKFVDVFNLADGTSGTSAVWRCCFANGAEWLRFAAGFVGILIIIIALRAGDTIRSSGSSSGTQGSDAAHRSIGPPGEQAPAVQPLPLVAPAAGALPPPPPSHWTPVVPPPTPPPTLKPNRTELDAAMAAAYAAVAGEGAANSGGALGVADLIADLDTQQT